MKIKQFLQRFDHQKVFTIKDVKIFYSILEESISNSTINWRINKLVQSGVISRVGRGKYIVGSSSDFKPIIGRKEKSIASHVKNHFPFIDYCVWN